MRTISIQESPGQFGVWEYIAEVTGTCRFYLTQARESHPPGQVIYHFEYCLTDPGQPVGHLELRKLKEALCAEGRVLRIGLRIARLQFA